jgi:hypothetical protein
MAEAIWYYAQEDREHGPVTGAYIAGMARTGKLRPEDLVWREGMEDWRPAKTIKGLFSRPGERPAGPSSDTAVLDSPFEARPPEAPPAAAPLAPSGPAAPEPPRVRDEKSPPGGPTEPVPPPPPVETGAGRFRESSATGFDAQPPVQGEEESDELPAEAQGMHPPAAVADSGPWLAPASRAAIALGLLLALFARGCEAVGARSVARLSAQAQLAEMRPNAKADELAIAARQAHWEHQAQSLWREICFLAGAVLVTLGAFAAAFFGAPPTERWIGVILLAVIAFGIFARAAPGLHSVNRVSASWEVFEDQTN